MSVYKNFTRNRIVSVVLLELDALISGCATMEEATVSGNRIGNGRIGYKGYNIETPSDYLSIDDQSLQDADFTLARAMMQELGGSFDLAAFCVACILSIVETLSN